MPHDIPTISDAKRVAKQFGLPKVAIFYVTEEGAFGGASYGKDRRHCGEMGRFLDRVHDMAIEGEIEIE